MVSEGSSSSSSGGLSGCADVRRLALQVLTGRWFMFFAACLIMSIDGTVYIFGLYTHDIKSALGYDQSTINLMSFFKDFGANFGIIAGLINEVTPAWVVLTLGAALNFSGYFMMWLSVTKRVATPAVWQMCLYIALAGNALAYGNVGGLITAVKNFPESRGTVIGVLKGYIGLSGAIVTQIYYAVYYNDSKALILLLAWLPVAVALVLLPAVRIMKKVARQKNEDKVIFNFLYLSLVLAAFLMMMIILEKQFNFTRPLYAASAAGVIFLLFIPMITVVNEEYKLLMAKKAAAIPDPTSPITITTQNPKPENDNDSKPTSSTTGTEDDKKVEKKEPSCWKTAFHHQTRGEDYTILQAFFSIDMLILFLSMVCATGGCSTAIDNLGQIGASLGYPAKSTSTFISLVSIWNYMGRVASGFGSEYILKKYKWPRPFMITVMTLVTCVGHFLIAFNIPNGLYVSSILIGFSFGAQWPLLFAIISEIFGLRYYSTLFNFGAIASPLGIYILNYWITGHLYDREATRQLAASGRVRKPGEQLSCVGVKCYQQAFLIIIGASLAGAVFSLILGFRTRKFYAGDIYKKFREGQVDEGCGTASDQVTKLSGAEKGDAQSSSVKLSEAEKGDAQAPEAEKGDDHATSMKLPESEKGDDHATSMKLPESEKGDAQLSSMKLPESEKGEGQPSSSSSSQLKSS